MARAAAWRVADMSDVDELVGGNAKAVRCHFEDLLSWFDSQAEHRGGSGNASSRATIWLAKAGLGWATRLC